MHSGNDGRSTIYQHYNQEGNGTLKVRDVVLLKDPQAKRMDWPIALVVKTLLSQDSKVCKVEVKVNRQEYSKSLSEINLRCDSVVA